jgi:hypothetical protein
MTSAAAAGGRAVNNTTETRKSNYNVLMDEEEEVKQETTAAAAATTYAEQAKKKDEESLEKLMAASVLNNADNVAGSAEEGSSWATATSKHQTKTARDYQPRTGRPTYVRANPSSTHSQQQQQQPSSSTSSTQPHHSHSQHLRPPREPINLSEETTLEFYQFPAAFRTPDLKAALEHFRTGRYRIKWNNDTSCWFVFDGKEARDEALKVVSLYLEGQKEESKFLVRIYKPEYYPVSSGADSSATTTPTITSVETVQA